MRNILDRLKNNFVADDNVSGKKQNYRKPLRVFRNKQTCHENDSRYDDFG